MSNILIKSKAIPSNPRSKNYPAGAVISSSSGGGTTVVTGGGGSSIDVLKVDDMRSLTDINVFSSLRTLYEIRSRIIANGDIETECTDDNAFSSLRTLDEIDKAIVDVLKLLEEKYISREYDDKAAGLITFLKGLISQGLIEANGGLQFGSSFIPGLLGTGGMIDGNARAHLRSLELYESLEVPELRFNRVQIYTGVRWDTFGGGIIESVDIDHDEEGNELQSGMITLKLEEGEFGAISIDDMAQGVYHNQSGNDTMSEDQRNGNFHFSGFSTSYFRITEILDEGTNARFRYVLRGISDRWNQLHHPKRFMHFACYANPTNKDRQSCTYTTTKYTIGLQNMTTWEYGEANIYKISGILDGFSLNGKHFKGTGDVICNGYFYGVIEAFENAPYRIEIDTQGDSFLAYGETMNITCEVFKGWDDTTDTVTKWTISRESGNASDDAAWAIDHKDFAGKITLTYPDLGDNSLTSVSTLFTITATNNTETAEYAITI